jgi:hypothetical protein
MGAFSILMSLYEGLVKGFLGSPMIWKVKAILRVGQGGWVCVGEGSGVGVGTGTCHVG